MVLSGAGEIALGLDYDRRSGYLYVAGYVAGDDMGLVERKAKAVERKAKAIKSLL